MLFRKPEVCPAWLLAFALGWVVAGPASAAPAFARHPTPAQIAGSLTRYGARETVSALFDQGRWDWVSDQIAAGAPAWVALAAKLAPGADAGPAEELPIDLALALPKRPRAVLAAVAGGAFAAADVCSAPFIEGTVRDVPAYKRRAQAAVAAVGEAKLAAARTACLAALGAAG